MSEGAADDLVSSEAAAIIENPNGRSPVVLICEHAGQQIPEFIQSLGLDAEIMSSHIAWDIGAAELSRSLSRLLDAPLILQRYSRLVYDCNRSFDASDAIVKVSDEVPVPANIDLSLQDKQRRFESVYQPFYNATAKIIGDRLQQDIDTVVVTIHSFTPVYKGKHRSVELGILHDADSRLADAVLVEASRDGAYVSARNQPYSMEDGVTHTLITHGINNGLPNLMLEIRNDLIANAKGQQIWADRIGGLLNIAVESISTAPKQ